MAMRNGRAGAYEFTVRLDEPNQLFEERPADVVRGRAPEPPGIQRIRDEVFYRPRKARGRATIVLPPDKATPEAERGIRQAIAHYCETGIDRDGHELAGVRHDGWRTLAIGAVILALGLALSEVVLKSKWPHELREFFGNGLFIVIAWVGLWYPLDTLIYAGRPYRSDRKMLAAIGRLEILVRAEGADWPAAEDVTAPEGAAPQSLTGG
jgi:hypothetical protein